ncbi:hypothetical protein [Aquihabitans sp. McL0605]|uniref:hypothetical protein n=1 Tax=Aquihabitans sp. McL0605 TaxID=3415671 RepID=UPI003CFAFB5F
MAELTDPDLLVDEPDQPIESEADPFPTVRERIGAWWDRVVDRAAADPGLVVEACVTIAVLVLGTGLVLATLHPADLFSNTTPTGGDLGSHVWGPRYLIDHLLPHFRLSGWTPDWYDGFPAYQFYMVVPSLIVVLLTVGLVWWLAIPLALVSIAIGLSGWTRRRLYPYRWVLATVGFILFNLAVPLSYNRSFKLVTALGLLTLPLACWALAKAAALKFPMPPLFAAAGVVFIFNREPVFNNTGNIIGGNFQSTMAGEFAFSISLTFAILYLAVAVRGLRTGKHRALAAVLFALAGLCHLIPAFFVLGCTAALFLVHPDRKRFRWLITMVPVAGLLTAFWVLPFYLRSDYVNDMGWERLPLASGDVTSVSYYLYPGALRYLFLLGGLGVVLSFVRRYSVGVVLGLAWLGVALGFWHLPQARLWNARLLPFMYLSVSLLAAIGVGETIRIIATAASGDVRRPLRLVTVGGAIAAAFGALIYAALPINTLFPHQVTRVAVTQGASGVTKTKSSWGPFSTTELNQAAGWSATDYRGLEKKEPVPAGCADPGSTVACTSGGWPEYKHLIQTMAGIGEDPRFGCGRAFWEYDFDREGGYGTPMALMMLPYFTDSCIGSQEGLYFESSATVPYHFLMQAELSTKPSSPQRDLPYPGFDIDAGVRHLQLMGVRYYMASTPNAVDQASRHPDLTEIAVSGPWHIYEVAQSEPVSALTNQPVVLKGVDESQDGWLPTASSWFGKQSDLDVLLAANGPEEWKRVTAKPVPTDLRHIVKYARDQLGQSGAIDQVPELTRTALPPVKVSGIDMGSDTISFKVDKVGVPVLVKASYFPNWEVSGAKGPYRVSPNLMVVIPTSNEVSMHFGRTPVDWLGIGLTLLGLVGLVWLARQPAIAVEPEQQPRLSKWIDRQLTIERAAAAPPADLEVPAVPVPVPVDPAPVDPADPAEPAAPSEPAPVGSRAWADPRVDAERTSSVEPGSVDDESIWTTDPADPTVEDR